MTVVLWHYFYAFSVNLWFANVISIVYLARTSQFCMFLVFCVFWIFCVFAFYVNCGTCCVAYRDILPLVIFLICMMTVVYGRLHLLIFPLQILLVGFILVIKLYSLHFPFTSIPKNSQVQIPLSQPFLLLIFCEFHLLNFRNHKKLIILLF